MVTIFDVGESRRVYEPIRITFDQVKSEKNQGIMLMGNETIDNLIKSIHINCPLPSPTKLSTPVGADLPVVSALTDNTQ